jgi:indolepyruvate ferredoxin oxidoreductase
MSPALPVALRDVSLDDKYALESGRVYLTGIQALVRLLILQQQRDKLAGLNTGGFVSGYRGSPLGGLDQSLWSARKFLERANVTFQPGLNEDLAATSIWGTQQVNLHPGATVDGVYAMWYGKGPAWTAAATCSSTRTSPARASTAACSRSPATTTRRSRRRCRTSPITSSRAAMIPVLYPSSVQEILDLGCTGGR